jgi:hypothetical protein
MSLKTGFFVGVKVASIVAILTGDISVPYSTNECWTTFRIITISPTVRDTVAPGVSCEGAEEAVSETRAAAASTVVCASTGDEISSIPLSANE